MRFLPVVAKMAFRNVIKYGRRSAETFLVVFAGVAAVALVDSFLNGFSDRIVGGFAVAGGHVRVSAPGYAARRATCPLDKLVADPALVASEAAEAAFAAVKEGGGKGGHTEVVALPSLRLPCALQHGERSSNVHATGAEAELPGNGLAPPFQTAVMAAGRFPLPGEAGMVLSAAEATRLDAAVGDFVIVLAGDAFGSFGAIEVPLLGVTRTDPGPDPCLVDMGSMRALAGIEAGAAEVALYLVDAKGSPVDPRGFPAGVQAMAAAVKGLGLEAARWDESGSTVALLGFFDSFIYAMYAIFLLVAGSGIANSVLLSVQGRTRDFATLRAVAFSAGWVKAIVALETLIVGASASLFAVAASVVAVLAFGPEGLRMPESVRGIADWMPRSIPARVDLATLAIILAGGSLTPLIAAAYPLRVLGKLRIREGLGFL
jgi:ABC-type lipoprotein release transport system permease subunit